ncbi:TPA: flagellar filament capping protein FliD [Escherichia coli]
MASISTLGVGSGLDLSSILDSLEAAEKSTLTPISKQQSSYTAKLSAYGTLKSALESFQTANTALNKADLFTATSTTSSSSAFSATTTGSAIAGKYTISVSQLAQAQTLTTKNSQKDSKAAIATSDSVLTIQQGGGKDPVTIDISAGNSSLSGIRDAINNAKAGVSASIINVGNGEYRLSITANDTGSNNAMKLSVSGDSALESFMGYNGTPGDSSNGMIESVTAQNAKLTVNNVEIENSSNTISDSLEDITLNLNDVTTGNQTLTISKDTSKAENAVKAWVDAYNTLQDTFSSLTKYTAVDAGAESQDSSNGALLGEMFIGDGKSTGVTTGISNNLTSWLSSTGIIQAAKDGVSKTLNNLTDQYNAASERIDTLMTRYKAQFTQLDVLMNSLNSTSSYLTQQFDTSNSNSK